MDSLTQMALGASVGYAVAGKEWGPKALLWGAVGGTIPDLDVIGNFFLDDLEGLAFHRGFTHSILFILLGPAIMVPVFRYYYRYKLRTTKTMLWIKWILIAFALLLGLAYILLVSYVLLGQLGAIISGGITLGLYYSFWLKRKWLFQENPTMFKGGQTSFSFIYIFFFATFITHVFIDVCTTYGTQIFYPFDLYRASFHNISVIDPLYTLPLLLGIVGSFYMRHKANWAGLIISSLYMVFTFYQLSGVRLTFEQKLEAHDIQYERYMVAPTLMNNFLWNGIAETDSFYYLAPLHTKRGMLRDFSRIRKDREGIKPAVMENGGNVLAWFSDGYYETLKGKSGNVKFKDLRFAIHYQDTIQTGMGFTIRKTEDGYSAEETRDMNVKLGEYIPYFRKMIWAEE